MQIDFHHAVTYVLSRLAGFPHGEAAIIAYSAQYVDDAKNRGIIEFHGGRTYNHIASSHDVVDPHNLWNHEDYQVWVPFHFLPGNNGAEAEKGKDVSVEQRLLCQPDSPLATDMRYATLKTKGQPNSLHRLGITTHVYADTFAHQRFSGERNRINNAHDEVLKEMKERIETAVANAVGLGHGAVSVLGGLPFLQDSGGTIEDDKAIRCTLASCQGTLHAGQEYASGLIFRGGLRERRKDIGAKDGKELPNSCQKYFHVLAV